MKLLIKIMYDGSGYCGFQSQKNSSTVQEKLNEAAKALFGFDCRITGCSRTDAGVHARGFRALIVPSDSENVIDMPAQRVPAALNFHLPEDIAVIEAEYRDDAFHPRYDVKSKTYEYLIVNSRYRNPLMRGRAWIPRRYMGAQSLEEMRKAASFIEGKHDFNCFMSAGSDTPEDTVRTVYSCTVTERDGLLAIKITADGFLYNMVRIIAGTLWTVGCGRIRAEEIPDIIESRDRARAGQTLPPYGLYLTEVEY